MGRKTGGTWGAVPPLCRHKNQNCYEKIQELLLKIKLIYLINYIEKNDV
jgi:hypothetical protein